MKQGITIVGLGPGDPNQLTLEAKQVLQEAREVYLRTCHHPTVASLPPGPALHFFDELYEEKETVAEVYDEIAHRVLELGRRPGGVVYAVPGHPLVGDERYEGGEPPADFPQRFLLHSRTLEFYHPRLKSQAKLVAPLPGDFSALLEQL